MLFEGIGTIMGTCRICVHAGEEDKYRWSHGHNYIVFCTKFKKWAQPGSSSRDYCCCDPDRKKVLGILEERKAIIEKKIEFIKSEKELVKVSCGKPYMPYFVNSPGGRMFGKRRI